MDRTQAPWEGSSVATVPRGLIPHPKTNIFFPAKYSAVSKRNSQGNCQESKSVSSFLLFYRRADAVPKKVRPRHRWDQNQGLLTFCSVRLLSRAGAMRGAVVGCGLQLWLPKLCIRGGNAPAPTPRLIRLRGCICRHVLQILDSVDTWVGRRAEERSASQTRGTPDAWPINSGLRALESSQTAGRHHVYIKLQFPSS